MVQRIPNRTHHVKQNTMDPLFRNTFLSVLLVENQARVPNYLLLLPNWNFVLELKYLSLLQNIAIFFTNVFHTRNGTVDKKIETLENNVLYKFLG